MRSLAKVLLAGLAIPGPASAAVVTACNTDVQGPGTTLQQAIREGGEVTFACPSPATIRVTTTHEIRRPVVIDGGAAVTLLIERASRPAFQVTAQQNLVLRSVTLRGAAAIPPGVSPGLAAFLVEGRATLTISDSAVRRLDKPLFVGRDGRAVVERTSFQDGRDPLWIHEGFLELSHGTFFRRWTTAVIAEKGVVRISGAQFSRSRLRLDECTFWIADASFADNDVQGQQLAGGALDTSCGGEIIRSTFERNKAVAGGAINLRGRREVTLSRSRFIGNQAMTKGGAIHRTIGGLLAMRPAPPLRIQYGVFRQNSAEDGGAIAAEQGVVDIHAGHFVRNGAAKRGGAVLGTVRVNRGVFVRNWAGAEGGGIHAYLESHPHPGLMRGHIANTVLAQNEAPRGAAVYGSGLAVINATIAYNAGPGLDAGQATLSPALAVRNSLLVGNTGGNCVSGTSPATAFRNDGSNLQFPNPGCPGIAVADPLLDPLYAPVVGSPALDAGHLASCIGGPVHSRDVYGEPRPQGSGCTIGAVEGAVDRHVYRRLRREPRDVPHSLLDEIRDRARALLR